MFVRPFKRLKLDDHMSLHTQAVKAKDDLSPVPAVHVFHSIKGVFMMEMPRTGAALARVMASEPRGGDYKILAREARRDLFA
jgi:hypothetical protein